MKTTLTKDGINYYSDTEVSQLLCMTIDEIQAIRAKHIERLKAKGLTCPLDTYIDGQGPYCQHGCLHWYVSAEKEHAFKLLYAPLIEDVLYSMDMYPDDLENTGFVYMYIETLKGVPIEKAVRAGIGSVVSNETALNVKKAVAELDDAMDDLEKAFKDLGI